MYYFCNKRTAIKYVQAIRDSSPAWFTLVEEFVKDGTGFMYSPFKKTPFTGNSLTVQWLELCTFTAEGLGSGEISEQPSDVLDSAFWGSCLQRELIRTQC